VPALNPTLGQSQTVGTSRAVASRRGRVSPWRLRSLHTPAPPPLSGSEGPGHFNQVRPVPLGPVTVPTAHPPPVLFCPVVPKSACGSLVTPAMCSSSVNTGRGILCGQPCAPACGKSGLHPQCARALVVDTRTSHTYAPTADCNQQPRGGHPDSRPACGWPNTNTRQCWHIRPPLHHARAGLMSVQGIHGCRIGCRRSARGASCRRLSISASAKGFGQKPSGSRTKGEQSKTKLLDQVLVVASHGLLCMPTRCVPGLAACSRRASRAPHRVDS
jgi:hypothetical protein